MTRPLDLAVIGNGRIAALVNTNGQIVWWCFPQRLNCSVRDQFVVRR